MAVTTVGDVGVILERSVAIPGVLLHKSGAPEVCAYLGELNCVDPSFFASSAPLLQTACIAPGIATQ